MQFNHKIIIAVLIIPILLFQFFCDNNPSTTEEGLETGTVTDIEGNTYRTVKIGNQWWMAENLRTTKYNDGISIPKITDDTEWENNNSGAYCYYNNDSTSNAIKYGALYNWYAVNTVKLAPEGWHVPTDAEWQELEEYLIKNGYNWDGSTTGNKIGKSMAAMTDWILISEEGAIGNDLTKNNKSGFSALPGGYRYIKGDFLRIERCGYWWSATEDSSSFPLLRSLSCDCDNLIRSDGSKSCGYSVRLLRD